MKNPMANPSDLWLPAFFDAVRAPDSAEALRAASANAQLAQWTRLLTTVVVNACAKVGWSAAAKGHKLERLPQVGQEYLGIDVMAFAAPVEDADPTADESLVRRQTRWPFPVAAFELENSRDDDRVAYSLWKVLSVRAPLRVVFAYRADWESGRALVHGLGKAVVESMPIPDRASLCGETLVLLGSRGEGETFPLGFFKVWRLDAGFGAFRKVP
jgi:hypothetical protein